MNEKARASVEAAERFVAGWHQLSVEEYRAIKREGGEAWDAISRWGRLPLALRAKAKGYRS